MRNRCHSAPLWRARSALVENAKAVISAWEIEGHHAFRIPGLITKNAEDRILYCNSTAWNVIEAQRGVHPDRVFTREGTPVTKIYNTGWKSARNRAGLAKVRVHDLRHTFGQRIRALGIEEMDRKDLMGHKNSDVSRLYCSPSINHLCVQAEKLVTAGTDPVLKLVGAA